MAKGTDQLTKHAPVTEKRGSSLSAKGVHQEDSLRDAAERAALAALSYDDALRALEADNPIALAVTEEYIAVYSQRAGKLLKEGKDYLALLADTGSVSPLERIAMEIVLEVFEDELNEEELSNL